MKIEALVRRKTVDLTRVAAEDLVRAAHPDVVRVDRGELWTFDVDDAGGEAEVRRLLDATTLVVNPNVHRVVVGDWEKAPASGARLDVIVRDRVDAKARSVLRSARERLGLGKLRGVTRAVVWSLDVPNADSAELVGLSVAGPAGGLLSNPHAQDVTRTVVNAT